MSFCCSFTLILSAATLCATLLSCDPSARERELFRGKLRRELARAQERIGPEGAAAASDGFRDRTGGALAGLRDPAAVWGEYRGALAWLRFAEGVERECPGTPPPGKVGLDEASRAAADAPRDPASRCGRLARFSELLGAIARERLAAPPGRFALDGKVRARVEPAASDGDCLVRAGYLFVSQGDKDVFQLAGGLVSSAETLRCGLEFVRFIEPGDVSVPLGATAAIAASGLPPGERKELLVLLLDRLAPLARQEPDALRRNLEERCRDSVGDPARRGAALLLLSLLPGVGKAGFFEEIALASPSGEERLLCLDELAEAGGKGLASLRRIVEKSARGDGDVALPAPLLEEAFDLFAFSWRSFPRPAMEREAMASVLRAAAKGRPGLERKLPHLERLYGWGGASADPGRALADAAAALRSKLTACWHTAAAKLPAGAAAGLTVRVTADEEGSLAAIAVEGEPDGAAGLAGCVTASFALLSFPPAILPDGRVQSVTLRFPFDQ